MDVGPSDTAIGALLMATLQQMLDGSVPAKLRAHLTTAPIPEPPSLQTLIEADFVGYAETEFVIQQQSADGSGFGFTQGFASFTYLGNQPHVELTAIYVSAIYQGARYLLFVVSLADDGRRLMPWGTTDFLIEASAYVLPGQSE